MAGPYVYDKCEKPFPALSGMLRHRRSAHLASLKHLPRPNRIFKHPRLTGRPCASDGSRIAPGTPPDPRPTDINWTPFEDGAAYKFAHLEFVQKKSSRGKIQETLQYWAEATEERFGEEYQPFESVDEMYATIDKIGYGEATWYTFDVRYQGPDAHDPQAPEWKRAAYTVYTRDPHQVLLNMLASSAFDGSYDYTAYKEYERTPSGRWQRKYSNMMSGQWAWDQSDKISKDPSARDATFVPFALGADKTLASNATGNTEFHPLYFTAGGIHNQLRRAHPEALVPLAFLSIPKAGREYKDDVDYRLFRKQLYHDSIAKILEPLRQGMTTPEVVKFPDGHYRRAIYAIGPFIADYPEQAILACIVQGWCPKCFARPTNHEFAEEGPPRFREFNDLLLERYADDPKILWESFGTVHNIVPFTAHFPRADIHELITPDILHQLIKGTFKDHLVEWVIQYIEKTSPTKKDAERILGDIDRRIAVAVAYYPGLRRFPQGRNFKQWTGNDSKALMKVFLPAIAGHVPSDMVRCIASFIDFCYLARRSSHTITTLAAMDKTLTAFHRYRTVFEDVGIRPDGFGLPRQHSLVHYVRNIHLFGSPNGLDSAITESKHIKAVKEPWRASGKHNPIRQIIQWNSRMEKMAASRTEFAQRGMLNSWITRSSSTTANSGHDVEDDYLDLDGEYADARVTMSACYDRMVSLDDLKDELGYAAVPELIRRFLYDQLYPGDDHNLVPLEDCPFPDGKIAIHHSARSSFYAPSDFSGTGGMHEEVIRANPSYRGVPRFDTVLVKVDDEGRGFLSLCVARVLAFLVVKDDVDKHPVCFVEWFARTSDEPDPITGMWIVKPEVDQRGQRVVDVIHVDCIVRPCYLIGVCGPHLLPRNLHASFALDTFREFYLNRFIDYNAHECI